MCVSVYGCLKLSAEAILLLARVFQIVDIYHTLASDHSYKPAFSAERSTDIFNEEVERGWRASGLMALFLKILQERPDDVRIPSAEERDRGTEMFSNIHHTGALTWKS